MKLKLILIVIVFSPFLVQAQTENITEVKSVMTEQVAGGNKIQNGLEEKIRSIDIQINSLEKIISETNESEILMELNEKLTSMKKRRKELEELKEIE